jgi:hypothetical protein
MADTKRDDPDAPSIAREEESHGHSHSHEMRVISSVVARADHGGERHDFPRVGTPQDKGPCDDDDSGAAPHWNDLTNHDRVVAPRDPDREGDFGVAPASAPITRQGLPSFAQSEFYTVYLILYAHRG